MRMHELTPGPGARRPRKRVGRGDATGQGTQAGKGTKGQKARTGGGPRPGFEGGQLPLMKRLPFKRGFHNPFRVEYQVVNVERLADVAAGTVVTAAYLRSIGAIKHEDRPVKLLGNGDLGVAITVDGVKVTRQARAKIEAAGGSVKEPEAEAGA